MQNTKQIPKSIRCEAAKYHYRKSSYVEIFEVFQSLRKDKVFCDIKLETDDGGIIFGHKVILASASPYFRAMFTNFAEKNVDLVVLRHVDFTALQLLVDFIYSGEIMVTEKNVQVLLPAANLLQLQEVTEACCDFLQAKLSPKNCISINELADLYSCTKLLTSSELYIQEHFSEVVEGDEFLFLSSETIVKSISSDELKFLSEEKIFECVIRWVKHDLDSRKWTLCHLMKHLRLPLISKNYIIKNVSKEPLINNCLKCKDYIIEALYFHSLKSDEISAIPQNIRTKPRLEDKVVLVVGGDGPEANISTEWYDPKINRWQFGPKMITPRFFAGLAVVKNNSVFDIGGINFTSAVRSVDVLVLSSETLNWKPSVDMIVERKLLGVGVINNYIYAVGGFDSNSLNSAEVFDCETQEWRMLSNMSTRRSSVGIGVLNNLLYAVGGFDSMRRLKSVECYHPGLDKWTTIAEMRVRRSAVGVGVLNGVVYAVGGYDGFKVHRSVEAYNPSIGVWTLIADMHLCRRNAGVVVLDGLLYVVGGNDGSSDLDSVEFYNPNINTWTLATVTMNVARAFLRAVAINRPRHFTT